jgi:hypothetical protein
LAAPAAPERLGALLLIFPGVWSDLLGAACLAAAIASQRLPGPDFAMRPA